MQRIKSEPRANWRELVESRGLKWHTGETPYWSEDAYYRFTTDEIDAVTGVIGMLDVAGFPGLMEVCAVVLALIIIVALMTYQVAYSRLIFVSGLERHLPRIFTHFGFSRSL